MQSLLAPIGMLARYVLVSASFALRAKALPALYFLHTAHRHPCLLYAALVPCWSTLWACPVSAACDFEQKKRR